MAATLLWIDRDEWSAYATDALGEPVLRLPAEEAERFGEALAEAGRHGPVVVALESDLCLAARFEAAARRQTRNRDLLAYQVEETLPVAAEEAAIDFHADDLKVLGVACDRDRFERILNALSSCDVRCVAPGALLAADGLAHERRDLRSTVWARAGSFEQIDYNGGGPLAWRSLPAKTSDLLPALRMQRLAGEPCEPDALIGPIDDQGRQGSELFEEAERVPTDGDPCRHYAALAAERIVRGEARPAIDLLRGAPESSAARRSPLRWEQRALAAATLLVVLGATAWQVASASHSERRLERLVAAEEEVFRQVFPDKRLPRGVRTRLQSELRRIAGARADLTDVPEHADATLRLEKLLSSLPTDLRYRLSEVRLEGGRLSLLGEARSHSDADRIAASVRKTGLVVAPPSTRQLAEKGVEFRLSAQPPEASP